MTFVSYAQNFEDVMLWRALKHIENGFYIDVGANDPTIESVTKAFYEQGWNGINIEPIPHHYRDLLRERRRDVNLQCAAGESEGEIEIWECEVRGWATASKPVIKQYQNKGHEGIIYKIPVSSLTEICKKYVKGEIHFLKIDVEGFEKSVIIGNDFFSFRPWIVVIEANKPNSIEESHEEWEEFIISAGYLMAYADGLNRFYISNEHKELLPSFKYPPNVFDDFIRIDQLNSEIRAQETEAKAVQAEAKAQQAETRAGQAEAKALEAETRAGQAEAKALEAETRAGQAEAKALEAETRAGQAEAALVVIYNSRLWRITAPWRWAGNVARWFASGSIAWLTFAPGSRPRGILLSILIFIKSRISTRPLLIAAAAKLLSPCRQFADRLRLIGNPKTTGCLQAPNPVGDVTEEIENLSPRARKIYSDLKAAIELRQKEQL